MLNLFEIQNFWTTYFSTILNEMTQSLDSVRIVSPSACGFSVRSRYGFSVRTRYGFSTEGCVSSVGSASRGCVSQFIHCFVVLRRWHFIRNRALDCRFISIKWLVQPRGRFLKGDKTSPRWSFFPFFQADVKLRKHHRNGPTNLSDRFDATPAYAGAWLGRDNTEADECIVFNVFHETQGVRVLTGWRMCFCTLPSFAADFFVFLCELTLMRWGECVDL